MLRTVWVRPPLWEALLPPEALVMPVELDADHRAGAGDQVPVLDSNLRFLGGVWLGVGLALLCTVPAVEQHGTLFRWLWIAVFLGGVGRLLSWGLIGVPRPLTGVR